MTTSCGRWGLAAVFVCAGASLPALARTSQTASAGLYTAAQAARGGALYGEHCAPCHGGDLTGTDFGPGLSGAELRARWGRRSLGELFSLMQATMPVNSPGGLSMQQNADILAFLLQRAQFPSGAKELPPRTDVLNGFALK
jgi:mono/diheme cytochrome c family protein